MFAFFFQSKYYPHVALIPKPPIYDYPPTLTHHQSGWKVTNKHVQSILVLRQPFHIQNITRCQIFYFPDNEWECFAFSKGSKLFLLIQ